MKIFKCTFLLLFVMLMFSCSKEKESDQDITLIVGDWIDIFGSNAEWKAQDQLGAFCTVTDDEVNELTVAGGTPYLYLKLNKGKETDYSHIPCDLGNAGSVSLEKLRAEGYVLKFSKDPRGVPQIPMYIRGLVIPEGKKTPDGLNMAEYEEVAEFFEITD
ncbi:MAG: hypothetical protein GX876_13770 [Bacteroidales bacterium]|nr:hypothetical protein [Bacteroidales bacterium]